LSARGPSGTRFCGLKSDGVWNENFQVYGVRKVWRQLKREAVDVSRCRVARLMRQMELAGVVRGKAAKITVSDRSAPCPLTG
jgi:hypothetical protein